MRIARLSLIVLILSIGVSAFAVSPEQIAE